MKLLLNNSSRGNVRNLIGINCISRPNAGVYIFYISLKIFFSLVHFTHRSQYNIINRNGIKYSIFVIEPLAYFDSICIYIYIRIYKHCCLTGKLKSWNMPELQLKFTNFPREYIVSVVAWGSKIHKKYLTLLVLFKASAISPDKVKGLKASGLQPPNHIPKNTKIFYRRI